MKTAVRYFSRGGSTETIAKAIARELREKAELTSAPIEKKVDLLFLGSGVYAGHIDPHVKEFIQSLDPSKVGKVAFFCTSVLNPNGRDKEVWNLLQAKGIPMDTRTFHCKGKFFFVYSSHPDNKDKLDAAIYAKKIAKL